MPDWRALQRRHQEVLDHTGWEPVFERRGVRAAWVQLPGEDVPAVRHLVAYHATPTSTALQLSDRYHRILRERFPGRTGILSWVAPGLSMPDKEVRALGADLFKAVAREIRCSATVIAGEGFWASTARSVLTGIHLLSRQPCPNRAFGKVDEAAAWMTGYFDPASEVEADGLAAAMSSLIQTEEH